MIENKEFKLGKDKVVIQSLPATRALSIAAKLVKLVGGAGAGITDLTLDPEEISKAFHVGNMVQGVIENIDSDEGPELIRSVIRESVVSPTFEGVNSEARFNEWYETRFSRQLQDLMTLLYEIFTFNYGDPVDWIKKGLAQATESGLLSPSVPSAKETNSE